MRNIKTLVVCKALETVDLQIGPRPYPGCGCDPRDIIPASVPAAEHGTGSRYISGSASQTVANTADVNDLASVISPGAPPDGPDGRAVLEPPPSPSQPYSKNKK